MNPQDQSQPTPKPKLRQPKNREYSKPQQIRAIVLNESGATVDEISLDLGLDEKIVKKMLAGKSIVDPKDVEKSKEEFCKDLTGLIYKLLKHANKEEYVKKLAEKGRDLAIVMGVAVDKLQLLTGKPTQITNTNDVLADAEKKLKELSELEEKLNKAIPPATGNN
jgi:predicted transcriptional regulator